MVNTGNKCKSWIAKPIVRSKISTLYRTGIRLQKRCIILVLIMSALATVINLVLVLAFKSKIDPWFQMSKENMFLYFFKTLLQWVISLSRLVPLNLMAALSLSDYYQSKEVRRDMKKVRIQGFSKKSYPRRIPKNLILNSKILSDLGKVRRVVTEVKGVLTQTKMLVERIRCGNELFDENYEEERDLEIKKCEGLVSKMSEKTAKGRQVREILRCMAICNSCGFVKPSMGSYAHSSPEEVSLCRYARKYGAVLMDHQDKMKIKSVSENFGGMEENNDLTTQRDYTILTQFEYDTDLERDSILVFVRNEEGRDRVVLYSKGSVEGVRSMVSHSSSSQMGVNIGKNKQEMEMGIECVFFARREILTQELVKIIRGVIPRFALEVGTGEHLKALEVREMMSRIPAENELSLRRQLESNMMFLGSASLKTMLDFHLHETFQYFKSVKINAWIASSKGVATCIYVARRLLLIGEQSEIKIIIQLNDKEDVSASNLSSLKSKMEQNRRQAQPFCLAVSSECFAEILSYQENDEESYTAFAELLFESSLGIFGGMNPIQKRSLVQISKTQFPDEIVLAVGSFSEDEMMVSYADIGLNLFSGTKYLSCKSSDIYLQKFHQLRLLLFSAGSEAQRKDSKIFLFCWFSSFLLGLPEFWSSAMAYFAPQRIASQWISSIMGVVFPLFCISIYAANDRIYSKESLLKLPTFFLFSSSG